MGHCPQTLVLPGIANLEADALSREQLIKDWCLQPKLHQLCSDSGAAQRWTCSPPRRTNNFHSEPAYDQQVQGVDALQHPRAFSLMFTFPPPHLMLQSLAKLAVVMELLMLITPWWQDAIWMGEAVALSVCPLLRLPSLRDSPSEVELAHYLWHLFQEKGLASATLGVHRAGVSSFVQSLNNDLSSFLLLQCFMRATFLAHSHARAHIRSTLIVDDVIRYLHSWGLIVDLSLRQLAQRTPALVLMFSCRRRSDLTLMGRVPPLCVVSQESVHLHCAFGLKQD